MASFSASVKGSGPIGMSTAERRQPAVVRALHRRPSITEIVFEPTFAT